MRQTLGLLALPCLLALPAALLAPAAGSPATPDEAEDNIGKSISVDCPGDGEEWYTMHAICKKCKTFE